MVTLCTIQSPVSVQLFLPEGPGPFPLICQTPLLGRLEFLDDLFFEKKIAEYFAGQGLACAVLERPIFQFDPGQGLEQLPRYVEESIARNEKALQTLLKNPKIDPDKIGTFGMSFGSIINCLWGSRNPNLKAHVLALGGANLPEIFMTSRDPLMKSYRKAALENTRMDAETLLAELKRLFTKDPLHLRAPLGPASVQDLSKSCLRRQDLQGPASVQDLSKSCLLILALFDRVIRFQYGLQLRKALGGPRTIFLPLGHYTAILTLPWMRRQAAHFFKNKFSNHAHP